MGNNPTIIRASSLPQYTDCARRSAIRLWPADVLGAGFSVSVSKPSIGALIGTATHHILERALRANIEGDTVPDFEQMQRIAGDELRETTANGVIWDDTTTRLDVGIKQAARQAKTAWDAVGRHMKPIGIEKEFSADMGDGFVLRGHLDVIEDEAINDWKTGNIQRANMAQYGGYSLLARSNGFNGIKHLREIYIERKGITKPQPDPIITEYNVADAEEYAIGVAKRMKADLTNFRETRDANAFLPNPNSMMCTPDYCPAFGTEFCKAHKVKMAKEELNESII